MAEIQKTVFTVTLMHRSDEPVDDMGMQDILREMDDGPMIGSVSKQSTEIVPEENVIDELQELGNDGKFFSDYEDD